MEPFFGNNFNAIKYQSCRCSTLSKIFTTSFQFFLGKWLGLLQFCSHDKF